MTPLPSTYPVKTIILGLIQQGRKYGYEIHKELSDPGGLGIIWNLRQSQLYLILKKMCMEGLVKEINGEKVHGRFKRSYEITTTGTDEFTNWLSLPVIYPRNFMQEFFPKYYFLTKYKACNSHSIIRIQIKKVESWLQKYQQNLEKCDNEFQKTIILYKLKKIEAIKDWLGKDLK